ncbi:hypothetical protein FBY40_0428 [Microbacterium sp. SLBN-154]|uniref:nucleotidyltransferase n=1 Tax=Microbacterium sp. SLBN-154 TaxID=2768458 RepID=UPI001150F730|nr:nucleotidyltransferase [Microbacterium sp. SLBN-154]TQK17945.1 hypothetical protein FBY40_0428 [Microbacterium sp. SLBN-154]
MSVFDAFGAFQTKVNADVESVREARRRRDVFRAAFSKEEDVLEVVSSGSLARGTQKDPIHDVDLILIYSADDHPEWGNPGASAAAALDHVRGRVNTLLGATDGSHDKVVRLARWRNHAVKCFLDDPNDESGFTVDVMPALRVGDHLMIPEAASEDWVHCDPESLIAAVATKHSEWNKFAGTIRMLKRWASDQDIKIKSLVMEVLALDHLPTSSNQPAAVKQFFVAATYAIEGYEEVTDPAGYCGPIQGDLDYDEFAKRLRGARDHAIQAIQASSNNDADTALWHWGQIFGADFPHDPNPVKAAPAMVAPRPVKDTPQG